MPGPSRKGKGKSKGRGGRGGGTRSQYGRGGAGRGGGRGLSARGGPGSFVGGAGGGGGGFGGFTGMSSAAEGMAHMPNPTLGPQFLPPGLSLQDALQGDPYGLNFGPHGNPWEAFANPAIQQQVPGYTGPTGEGGFTSSVQDAVKSLSSPFRSLRDISGGGGGGGGLASPTSGAPAYGGGGGGGGTQYDYNAPGGGSPTYSPNYTGKGGPVLGSNTPKGGVYLPGLTPHSGDIGSDFGGGGALPGMQYFGPGGTTIADAPYEANKPGGGAPHYNPNYGGGGGGGKPTATTHRWGGARGTGWATNPNNPNYGQPRPGVGPSGGNAGGAAGGGTEPTYNPNYGNQSLQDQKPKDKQVLNRYAGKGGL